MSNVIFLVITLRNYGDASPNSSEPLSQLYTSRLKFMSSLLFILILLPWKADILLVKGSLANNLI